MSAPRITACIVSYRSNIRDILEAVRSIKACSLPVHLLVVDNFSSEAYRAELSQSLTEFSDVRLLGLQDNRGFGAGHNAGFKEVAAISDFHLIVNPDIVVHEGAIEAMAHYMQQHMEVGLIAPKVVDEQGELQYLCKRCPSVLALFGRRFMPDFLLRKSFMMETMNRYHMRDKDYTAIMEPECISGCFMMFRSNIFREIGGFDERFFLYFEDNDITLRVRHVSKAIYLPSAVVTHAWQGGARKSITLTKLQIVSAFKFFNKWGWRLF